MSKEIKTMNFVGKRKIFFTISLFLIVISLLSSFLGVNLAIEFKGGTMLSYSYTGDIDINVADNKIEEIVDASVTVQQGDDLNNGLKNFSIAFVSQTGLTAEKQYELTSALKEIFTENEIELVDSNDVSPTSGKEFFLKCIVAILLASVLLIIYIGFRFKKIGGMTAGVFAIIALLHDVVIVYGTFNICRFEINANFIAVVLTILGCSINNTIVIYDRIRENKDIMDNKTSFDELINVSISQSLTRSLNTTAATVTAMAVVCIVALIGNLTSILNFSFPLMIGMISGAYSSLCLAPNLWGWWNGKKGIKTIKDSVIEQNKKK